MRKVLTIFLITNLMQCENKTDSIYQILAEKRITKITIESYQFIKRGKILMQFDAQQDIEYFKSWFKPSMHSKIDNSKIKRFKADGIITIFIKDEKPLEIHYQLFNCYFMNYQGKRIYEQFSYQFGQTLLEQFEEEAKNAGNKFNL